MGLKISDLHEQFLKVAPEKFRDLLDIATYVYCADQATERGKHEAETFGKTWRRSFRFHIPVREPDFWNSQVVKQTLIDTVSFLSDDNYEFTFVAASNAPPIQHYFEHLAHFELKDMPSQVILFSGGLDSLAGAVTEAIGDKRRVLLVNHRPTPKLNNVHQRLKSALAEKSRRYAPMHVYVRINKNRELNKSYLQRARSFLYMAIAGVAAEMVGQKSVRFYENGIVSLNLPVTAQVVGSRATRTTHPRVLKGYENLLKLVSGHDFTVDNPFIWNTKGEVIEKIVRAGCSELIAKSISCAHTFTFSNEHPHCGTCSQCIDRRFGVLAANAEKFDPSEGYESDVFIGKRPKTEDRMMVALYVERAKTVANIKSAAELITKYPEALRALKYLGEAPMAGADKMLEMHQRHGKEVKTVLADMVARHKEAIADGTLENDCLLRLAYDSGPGLPYEVELPTKAHEKQEKRWEEQKESPNGYALRRGNKWWELIFEGKREIVQDDRGMCLIDELLKNPPEEPIHAVVLESRVDGAPVSEAFALLTADGSGVVSAGDKGVLSEASGRRLNGQNSILRTKMAELREIQNDETLPLEEREAAEAELQCLVASYQKGGKVSGQASLAAERVRKAMRRKIDEFKKAELRIGVPNEILKAFGEHLDKYIWFPSMGGNGRKGTIGSGGCYIYERPQDVIWKD
ncbi:MAG: 7-cyano-7-deazaguanine synthase [Verrucomicrobia bacterium]|nr:7-cyano-7-deazaguanine synthase [Verrucomicrobiota bacterium]